MGITERRSIGVVEKARGVGELSPSSHKFGDEFIASGLSAEGAITGFGSENT